MPIEPMTIGSGTKFSQIAASFKDQSNNTPLAFRKSQPIHTSTNASSTSSPGPQAMAQKREERQSAVEMIKHSINREYGSGVADRVFANLSSKNLNLSEGVAPSHLSAICDAIDEETLSAPALSQATDGRRKAMQMEVPGVRSDQDTSRPAGVKELTKRFEKLETSSEQAPTNIYPSSGKNVGNVSGMVNKFEQPLGTLYVSEADNENPGVASTSAGSAQPTIMDPGVKASPTVSGKKPETVAPESEKKKPSHSVKSSFGKLQQIFKRTELAIEPSPKKDLEVKLKEYEQRATQYTDREARIDHFLKSLPSNATAADRQRVVDVVTRVTDAAHAVIERAKALPNLKTTGHACLYKAEADDLDAIIVFFITEPNPKFVEVEKVTPDGGAIKVRTDLPDGRAMSMETLEALVKRHLSGTGIPSGKVAVAFAQADHEVRSKGFEGNLVAVSTGISNLTKAALAAGKSATDVFFRDNTPESQSATLPVKFYGESYFEPLVKEACLSIGKPLSVEDFTRSFDPIMKSPELVPIEVCRLLAAVEDGVQASTAQYTKETGNEVPEAVKADLVKKALNNTLMLRLVSPVVTRAGHTDLGRMFQFAANGTQPSGRNSPVEFDAPVAAAAVKLSTFCQALVQRGRNVEQTAV